MVSLSSYRALIFATLGVFALAACGDGGGESPRSDSDAGPEDGSTPSGDASSGLRDGGDAGTADPSLCGNRRVDPGEACDDGNRAPLDGCSDLCQLEPGARCDAVGAACVVCGNGIVESGELCDDRNYTAGDGCDASCQPEGSGWQCPVAGQFCELCGNGVLEPNERCDDGNRDDGDGCSANCYDLGANYRCPVPGGACELCGDGVLGAHEACDDGNIQPLDGCVPNCQAVEAGWVCPLNGGSCSLCGDGVIDPMSEECDDGNFQDADGCSISCKLELGAVCWLEGEQCSVCGNGVLEVVAIDPQGTSDTSDDTYVIEQCDDKNAASGDGCSSTCQREANYLCPLAGYGCYACGNGVREGIEKCDDGNLAAGDGCSADCLRIELGYSCPTSGELCVRCGDAIVQAGEQCDDGNVNGGDGCGRTCQIESDQGYRCQVEGQTLVGCAKCGDSLVQLDEQCDDGNSQAGDGCSADCLSVEASYNCFFVGYACALCGDGVRNPGEECDEGTFTDGVGCDSQCQLQAGYTCAIAGERCTLCGDGQREGLESCDDGNLGPADGCSSECQVEAGYDCSTGTCLAAACGDGYRAGTEECDDGNARSGDGCSIVCDIEEGFACVAGTNCHRTVCGDTIVEGTEQCDDGASTSPGCDDACQLELGYHCPTPGSPCVLATCGNSVREGSEQCDDGNVTNGDGCTGNFCQFEPGYYCPTDGAACLPTVCGDGLMQGLESCDDGNTVAGDGCSASCAVETFYRCQGEPSSCRPLLEFAAVRRFTVSNVSPAALVYDPARRSFGGHKQVASQKPIELCLDGTVINPNDTTAGPYGTMTRATGAIEPVAASYSLVPAPVSATMLEAAYDPFTGHFLYLTKQGSTVTLTDVPLCTVTGCTGRYYRDSAHPDESITRFETALSGAPGAEGLTVGEDGDLYVTDSGLQRIAVFARRRNADQSVYVPDCAAAAQTNCTTFTATAIAARGFAVPTSDVLDAVFTVPGERMVGVFNQYAGAPSYVGKDAITNVAITSSQHFSFYAPDLLTNPPLYGRSALPGLLFKLGTLGTTYTKYAQSAETASDGGSFIICPQNPSEPCQLFARTCSSDAECAEIAPGTRCQVDAEIPYCASEGEARDDVASVQSSSTANVIDVLANDSRSESTCIDPRLRVVAINGNSSADTAIATAEGGSVRFDASGTQVTYAAPTDRCGFIDTFSYTADLGGNVRDDATVRILVKCVCGDGVLQVGEQCDLGAQNGPLPAPCSDVCLLNANCGDGIRQPSEECDDANRTAGDGCSPICSLETVCGNGRVEGVEECDDGNQLSGDGCSDVCTVPYCGDGLRDFDNPDGAEECDEGVNNGTSGSACTVLCTTVSRCGDGSIDDGEQCDDGNIVQGDGCGPTCSLESACGDGIIGSGEECDPAYSSLQCGGYTCSALCRCENYCGDGRVGGTETCDDGNTVGGDTCNADCSTPYCGDARVDTQLMEQCDDGNTDPADACTNDCKLVTVCGNGTLEGSEQCDDGNNLSGDGCSSTCGSEVSQCGNNVREFDEQCDDGNLTAGDGCDASCRSEGGICGDGVRQAPETCDDGNRISGDSCDSECQTEIFVQ